MSRSRSRSRSKNRVPVTTVGLVLLLAMTVGLVVLALRGKGSPYPVSDAPPLSHISASTMPTAQPTLAPVTDRHMLIVGDSFTVGIGASTPENGYAYLLKDRLAANGWDVHIDGFPGSGYTATAQAGPTETYAVRIAKDARTAWVPSMVLIEGGVNDGPQNPALTTAVAATIRLVGQTWPKAQVVLVTSMGAYSNTSNLTRIDDSVTAGAGNEVPVYSPTAEGVVTEDNSSTYINSDGLHPTDAGHAKLADEVYRHLKSYGLNVSARSVRRP